MFQKPPYMADLKLKVVIFGLPWREMRGMTSNRWNQFPIAKKQGVQPMKMSLEAKYNDCRGGIDHESLA